MILLLIILSFSKVSIACSGIQPLSNKHCEGSISSFSLINPIPNANYIITWNPIIGASLTSFTNNTLSINFFNAGSYTVTATAYINGSQVSQCSLPVSVTAKPNPILTQVPQVGCLGDPIANDILIPLPPCLRACAESQMTYQAQSQPVNQGSTFNWAVSTGGSITGPSTNASAIVNWNVVGTHTISLTENNNGCSTTNTFCIEAIPSPKVYVYLNNLQINHGGAYNLCAGQTAAFQSVDANGGSTSTNPYTLMNILWDFGDGSTALNAAPSHVYTAAGTYNVTVTFTNECNCQTTYKYTITVDDGPSLDIQCNRVNCENNIDYYCTSAECTEYNWTVAGGQIMVNDQMVGNTLITAPSASPSLACDRCITVVWNDEVALLNTQGKGFITLSGTGCQGVCTLPTTVEVPILIPPSILGPVSLCAGELYVLSVPQYPATNYTWGMQFPNLPTDITFISPTTNSNQVTIQVASNPTSSNGTIMVEMHNTIRGCRVSAGQDRTVTSKPELTLNASAICINQAQTVSFTLNGTTTFTPTGTYGVAIMNPTGTSTFNATINVLTTTANSVTYELILPSAVHQVPGTYYIRLNAAAATFCQSDLVIYEVRNTPPAPTSINGSSLVCGGIPYNFTAMPLQANTFFNWQVTPTTSATFSPVGNVNGITFGAPATTYTVAVQRGWGDLPTCLSNTYTTTVNRIVPQPVTIASPQGINPCEDGYAAYSIGSILQQGTGQVLTPEGIVWEVLPNGLGSILSGQGTGSINVTWNHFGGAAATVQCKVILCGQATIYSYPVTLASQTSVTTFTSTPQPICSGAPAIFSLTTGGAAAASFVWNFGDNTSTTTTLPTATHQYSNFTNGNLTFNGSVSITSVCGAVTIHPFTAIIMPQPNALLTPLSVFTFCTGSTPYTYNGTVSNNSFGAYSINNFVITNGGTPVGIGAGPTIVYTPPALGPGTTTKVYAEVINNVTGCLTRTPAATITENDCNAGNGCNSIPNTVTIGPANALGCAQINVNATFSPAPLTYSWGCSSPASTFTITGAGSTTQSPTFTFNKAGIHNITLNYTYSNADPTNTLACSGTKSINVTIPLVADIVYGIVCNGTNNGYLLNFQDNSAVYPGFPILNRSWTLSGPNGSQSFTTVNATNLPLVVGASYTLSLSVSNGTGLLHNCTKSIVFNVPNLPQASFIATTDHPSSNAQTCEGNSIILQNTSIPTGIASNWNFGGITNLIPGYSPSLNAINLTNNSNTGFITNPIILAVTDNSGCTSTTQQSFSVWKNNFVNAVAYTYLPNFGQTVCFNANANPISIFPNPVPATVPSPQLKWFNLSSFTGITTSTPNFTPPINQSGAYWASARDANNCRRLFTPTPSNVTYVQPISIQVVGKNEYCDGETIQLQAINASSMPVNYTWSIQPPIVGTQSGPSFVLPTNGSGIYTLTLSGTQAGGIGCAQTLQFTVEVHPTPNIPVITCSGPPSCQPYALNLQAASALLPGQQYNWSNGDVGIQTTITAPGTYTCWFVDQWGCRSFADYTAPQGPESYMWRLPQACDRFCSEDMQKWVDGPAGVTFNEWAWHEQGSLLTNNTPFTSSGSNSPSDPLNLQMQDLKSTNYTWLLQGDMCGQVCNAESNEWPVDMHKCCSSQYTITPLAYNGSNAIFNLDAIPALPTGCNWANLELAVYDANNIPVHHQYLGVIPNGVQSLNQYNIGLQSANFQVPAIPPTMPLRFFLTMGCVDCTQGITECINAEQVVFVISEALRPTSVSKCKLVPNPTTASTTLLHPPNTGDLVLVKNALGKVLIKQRIESLSTATNLLINDLVAGTYIIEVYQADKLIETLKLIKQ